MSALKSIVFELRRREVFRAAGLYIVGSWVVLQVAALAFQSLGIPDTALAWVWIAVFVGFPLAMLFAWRYEMTMKGIVRTPPAKGPDAGDLSLRSVDYVILTSLAAVVAITVAKTFIEIGDIDATRAESANERVILANSIAVLPLDNLSGDSDQEYFVSGMHDALITALTRVSGLKVISKTSTEQYRDSQKSLPDIGSELGVSKVIEGSVLRVDDQVRITVQLIDAALNEHIWSESYERSLINVLQLQSDVARAIANQVKVQLTPYEDAAFANSPQVNLEAYEYYLKGRFHWYRFAEGDLELALEYFQRAIDEDPGYALAYVGFADALATPAHLGMMPTKQVFPAAKGFAKRAIELDPDLAEAHDFLARIHFVYDWDWDAAERGFRRSISLNSGYPDVHVVYSQFLGITNRREESLLEAQIGVDLDPLNPWFRMELAQRLAWFGRYDEAFKEISAVIDSQPDFYLAYEILWMIEHQQHRFDEALRAASRYFELIAEDEIASILRETGADYIEVMQRAADLLESNSARPYVSNVEYARLRVYANDIDRAIEFLEEAYVYHESALVYATVDPQFRPVWSSARYQDLLRKVNLRQR
jgi:TolB-like protein